MEWIDSINETLNYIETNIEKDISILDVAKNANISLMYLQKSFSILTGYTLGEYIRNRRLYLAALEIRDTNVKIIDIAYKYFYDTPEAFTKAFYRFHGINPSRVKKEFSKIRTFLPLCVKVEIKEKDKMDYVVAPMWGFKIIGFERTFTSEEAYKKIPEFWDEICQKYCYGKIYAGKAPSCPEEQAIIDNCIGEYAVCIDDLGGDKFRYIVGGKYTGGVVPEGMSLVEIPGGDWIKFKCIGKVPEAFQALNTRIFKEFIPNCKEYKFEGKLNIEWYSCDLDQNDDNYESGIWLPVTKIK